MYDQLPILFDFFEQIRTGSSHIAVSQLARILETHAHCAAHAVQSHVHTTIVFQVRLGHGPREAKEKRSNVQENGAGNGETGGAARPTRCVFNKGVNLI